MSGLAGSLHARTFSSLAVFGDSLSVFGNPAQSRGLPAGASFAFNPDPVWAGIVAQASGAPGTNSLTGGLDDAPGACRQMFPQFVRLCRELKLFGRELVAVDGTRIKTVNIRERNFTKTKLEKALAGSDEKLPRYRDRLYEAGGQDDGSGGEPFGTGMSGVTICRGARRRSAGRG